MTLRSDFEDAIARGRDWLARATAEVPVRDPYAGAIRAARRDVGLPADFAPLIAHWHSVVDACDSELRRYPWLLSYKRWIHPPEYAGKLEQWQSWREAERQRGQGSELSYWFAIPVVVCQNSEILEGLAAAGDATAAELIARFAAVIRREFAGYITAERPWIDTFALWNLARTERLFARVQPLAVALAMTFAAAARERDGIVHGRGFPYHQVPLASASAHLARALVALGLETALLAPLLAFLAAQRRESGGWGDGTDPEDALTTFVAAELLSGIDPGYEPREAAHFLIRQQDASGCWRLMGPEAPWITHEIMRWLGTATQPFARRFRWPRMSESTMDSKTGVPGFGYFRAFAELAAALPGLAQARTELAFLDLAGFKKFNDRFGQDAGDDVISELAHALAAIPDARVVRDGGDEFLVLGAPTDDRLEQKLAAFLERWPATFAARFGADAPVVAPRVALSASRGAGLRALREELGRAITRLKQEAPTPSPSGFLKRVGE